MILRMLLFSFCLFFLLIPVTGQSRSLKNYAERFLQASGAPGVSVSVLQKGQIEPETLVAGEACVQNSVAMSTQTITKVGSVTKVFTALRIQMLIEEKKLHYDTAMSHFFSGFPRADEITIEHLLTHTSGLKEMLMVEPFHSNLARAWKPEEILNMVAKEPLDFSPGTQAKYSNTGFLVLGLVIEKLTGQSYYSEVMKSIAVPLGMTTLHGGDDQTLIANESCGYGKDSDGHLRKPMLASMIPPLGTGDLLMRSQDLVLLVNQGKILKTSLLDTAHPEVYTLQDGKPAGKHEEFLDMSYTKGFSEGFFIWKFSDRPMTLVGKLGMFPGFSACFFYDPETRYGVAVTTNIETAVMEAMKMAVQILEDKKNLVNP